MSCKIVHISDTHLGYTDLQNVNKEGVNVREADFYNSFRYAIDKILEIKPDVVVHSGDFFHRPSPANRPMVEGLNQLKRLSDVKIPLVGIAGNHSTPRTIYTSPILEAFRSIDHVYPVFEQRYEAIEIDGAVFHGLPHVNDDGEYLRQIEAVEPVQGKVNIFIVHTSIGKNFIMDEYGERIFPGKKIAMLQDFDYTAAGHWHNFQKIKGMKNAVYSGSTERLSDREAGKEKGLVIADISEDGNVKINFEPLPTRNWFRFDIKECHKKTVKEIQKEINEAAVSSNTIESIVSVYLHNISAIQSVDVPNAWITEQFPQSLSVNVKREFFRKSGEMAGKDIKSESLNALFDEFVKKQTEDKNEYDDMIKLANDYFHRYETGRQKG